MHPHRLIGGKGFFAWGIWIFGLAVLLSFRGVSLGSSGDYLIDVWRGGGDSGLPNSSVTTIAQTPDGYLWAGTYNGLVRFDGVRFEKKDPDNTPELKRARVRKLYLDETGTLWINTYDGSLTSLRDGKFALEWVGDGSFDSTAMMISGRSNRLVFLLHTGELIVRKAQVSGDEGTNTWERLRPPGMSTGTACVEDEAGVLWGRGRDQRLWRYKDGAFELIPADTGLEGTLISCLTTDAKGGVWVGTEKEVAKWNGIRFENMTPTNGEPILNVAALYVASGGEAWVIANERVRKAQGRQWVYEAEPCAKLFPRPQERLGMKEDRNGAIWLYHYGRGLFHIRRDGQTRQLDTEEDFPGERVDCFFEDREGNLWCGVDRGGLVRLRQKRFLALIPPERTGRGSARSTPEDVSPESQFILANPRGAAKAAVSVAEDDEGAIWIGTYGGGLFRLMEGEWQRFPVPTGARRSFVFSICPAAGNKVWLSAGEEDLFCRTNREIQQISTVHGVKCLLAARDGRIWVGNKSGLWVGNESQFRMFRAEDGIHRTDVRALAEDASGAIWAGAGDGMLYRIARNKVESLLQANDALGGQPIWSLYADEDGTLWIGTFRGGLLRYKAGTFARYTSKDGLPDDVICQILEDDDGRLWIGCQQGIFSVAKDELDKFAAHEIKRVNCTAYGRYDGLPSVECSGGYQPAAWRTRDGRLLFSTLGGVVSVDPENLAANRLPPPVVIEDVLVNGTSLASEVQSPKSNGVLEIAPGKRQLEFRYTGLSFVSPDRVRFRYKLDGADKEYVEAGTHRSVQYNYLPPGNYTFHVQACNNDGVWNEAGAALQFHLLPQFYETWWFKVAAWVAGAGLVAAIAWQIVLRRMRRKMRDLERQQALERDRARIAQDIHDDLGAGLTQIMLLSELARREPATEVPSHLGQISDMARGLTRKMDEIVWAVDPQHDTLPGFMDYASAFTEEFLRMAGLRCRMDLPTELPRWPMDAETRYNLFLALKEALNNIVRHAHATEVRVGLRLANNSFTLVIEDDGKGMAGAKSGVRNENGAAEQLAAGAGELHELNRLHELHGATSPGSGDRLSSGHGVVNMQKRLRAVGGECVLHSANGSGTKVEMTVRVKNGSSPIVGMAHAVSVQENGNA
jgi:ligand-binding sensor domain-containing protein/signal transduction histidine kinase